MNTIIIIADVQFDMTVIVADDDLNDVAAEFGKQDAQGGEPCCPGLYYYSGTAAYNAYIEAYDLATAQANPPARLTPEQMAEIEAERPEPYQPFTDPALRNATGRMQEEPGYAESTQPYLY